MRRLNRPQAVALLALVDGVGVAADLQRHRTGGFTLLWYRVDTYEAITARINELAAMGYVTLSGVQPTAGRSSVPSATATVTAAGRAAAIHLREAGATA